MGTYGWGTKHPVKDWLFEEGHRFDFYQAVRLLETIYPGRVSVGETTEPDQEAVRFRSNVDLTFAASEINEVLPAAEEGEPATMSVNFFGLAGGGGPLPAVYTELIIERIGAKDRAFEEFLNIFNHRLISLLYRIRRVHRMDFAVRSPEDGDIARQLFSLFGLGTRGLRNRLGVPDKSMLFHASFLAKSPRTISGLKATVANFLGVTVESREMVGRWLKLDDDQQTSLGRLGQNNALGRSVVIGSRVWDQQGGFELTLGPLSYEKFTDLLPGSKGHKSLVSFVQFFAGTELDFGVILKLNPASYTGCQLGSKSGARLGWTSWLGTKDTPGADFTVQFNRFGAVEYS